MYAGLSDKEGGRFPILLGVNDQLLERASRSISRADVAELCVQSLGLPSARNRSIDCINDSSAGEGAKVQSSREDFDALFTGMAENADYGLNVMA
jgi:hypothetical protein